MEMTRLLEIHLLLHQTPVQAQPLVTLVASIVLYYILFYILNISAYFTVCDENNQRYILFYILNISAYFTVCDENNQRYRKN